LLIEHDLFRGRIDKVAMAIERLKAFEPAEGYYLAYSGGKDSDTILALAKMAGVKYDAHYHLTTVDAPETVYHVRKHKEVEIDRPEMTMWQLIRKKGFLPTRVVRYCCEYLKERGGDNRIVMTGVRAKESIRRSKRQMTEACLRNKRIRYFNPIIDWENDDVWEFIRTYKVEYCKLYDEGFKRLGCVMCPLGSGVKMEMERYPKIAKAYRNAMSRAIISEKRGATTMFKDVDEYFNWWLSGKGKQEDGGLFT